LTDSHESHVAHLPYTTLFRSSAGDPHEIATIDGRASGVRIHRLPGHRKKVPVPNSEPASSLFGEPRIPPGEDISHSTESNDGVLMNTTYHDKNHSRLGDIVDGIKLTKVHYLALLLVVTG